MGRRGKCLLTRVDPDDTSDVVLSLVRNNDMRADYLQTFSAHARKLDTTRPHRP